MKESEFKGSLSSLWPVSLNSGKTKILPVQFLMQTEGLMGPGPVLRWVNTSWHPSGLCSSPTFPVDNHTQSHG